MNDTRLPHEVAPRRSPRQLSAQREQDLLAIACGVFIERGLGGATIDLIAERSGISKATIYRRYRNKEELFDAVIRMSSRALETKLGRTDLDPDDPERSLRAAAMALGRVSADETHVEFMRLVVSEVRRHPETCGRARTQMIHVLVGGLATYFELLIARGQMQHSNAHYAANTFVLIFSRGFRPLYGALEGERAERRRFEADMNLFLRGCAIRSPHAVSRHSKRTGQSAKSKVDNDAPRERAARRGHG